MRFLTFKDLCDPFETARKKNEYNAAFAKLFAKYAQTHVGNLRVPPREHCLVLTSEYVFRAEHYKGQSFRWDGEQRRLFSLYQNVETCSNCPVNSSGQVVRVAKYDYALMTFTTEVSVVRQDKDVFLTKFDNDRVRFSRYDNKRKFYCMLQETPL
ncbi:hypothetical protein HK097_010165 [Rhizophlyctis rosea]|uniref:Uncharacterized protein n=1 Tax=Rhizophlyctis rosea TaxID=64517 RepID=A0AAD5SAC3_9FUNG|nr:hypothetical protein HK097_010165 [Rhizophlyctis rosea]